MGLPLHTPAFEESPTRSILCVQPDRDMRALLQQALSSYNLVLVSTGLEAIRHLQTTTFDAYVLDYRLPPTSGVHLCRHIRRSDPHTPVCFYTQEGSEQQRSRAFKAGASAYVVAASGPEALCDELRALLEPGEGQNTGGEGEHMPPDEPEPVRAASPGM